MHVWMHACASGLVHPALGPYSGMQRILQLAPVELDGGIR